MGFSPRPFPRPLPREPMDCLLYVCVCVCATVPRPSLWERNLGAECSSVAFVVGNVIVQLPRAPLKKQIWLLWRRNTQGLIIDAVTMREADAAPAETTSFGCTLIINNSSRETQFLQLGSLAVFMFPLSACGCCCTSIRPPPSHTHTAYL